jgi:hypothetical protein
MTAYTMSGPELKARLLHEQKAVAEIAADLAGAPSGKPPAGGVAKVKGKDAESDAYTSLRLPAVRVVNTGAIAHAAALAQAASVPPGAKPAGGADKKGAVLPPEKMLGLFPLAELEDPTSVYAGEGNRNLATLDFSNNPLIGLDALVEFLEFAKTAPAVDTTAPRTDLVGGKDRPASGKAGRATPALTSSTSSLASTVAADTRYDDTVGPNLRCLVLAGCWNDIETVKEPLKHYLDVHHAMRDDAEELNQATSLKQRQMEELLQAIRGKGISAFV